jgi:hypothetical protein
VAQVDPVNLVAGPRQEGQALLVVLGQQRQVVGRVGQALLRALRVEDGQQACVGGGGARQGPASAARSQVGGWEG